MGEAESSEAPQRTYAIARSTPIGLVRKLRRADLNVTHIFRSAPPGAELCRCPLLRQVLKNPKNEDLDSLERNKDMGDMPNSADGAAGSKIFVGGLDRSVDEGVVRSFFQQFGPVVEVRIVVNVLSASLRARNLTVTIHQVLVIRDPHNHQSRGFGFITFQRDESAK